MALLLFILLTDAANEENKSFSRLTDIHLYQKISGRKMKHEMSNKMRKCVSDSESLLDESIRSFMACRRNAKLQITTRFERHEKKFEAYQPISHSNNSNKEKKVATNLEQKCSFCSLLALKIRLSNLLLGKKKVFVWYQTLESTANDVQALWDSFRRCSYVTWRLILGWKPFSSLRLGFGCWHFRKFSKFHSLKYFATQILSFAHDLCSSPITISSSVD